MKTPSFSTLARTGLAIACTLFAADSQARDVLVGDATALRNAINAALPDDVIILQPGTYDVTGNLSCDNAGSVQAPIVVRSPRFGEALIRFDALEGFHVTAPNWRFENLDIQGVCADHNNCEHGFHIVAAADNTVVRGSRLRDFNAHIKGNGNTVSGSFIFADDVLIENNHFDNATPRNTSNPCTPIDIVGGRRWIVRGNTIEDFAKGQGDQISYAAFLKGNSRDGLFERNLVICERDHTAGIRLGLSFGGGGTSPNSICEDANCTPEHQNGIMRNNIIINCPDDVGIYLNEGFNVRLYNNTLFNTTGIDVRFQASVADIRNNLLMGSIRNRDLGTSTQGSNLTNLSALQFQTWFANPAGADFRLRDGSQLLNLGENRAEVPDDFCGNTRNDGANDRGAVEFDGDSVCITTVGGGDGIFIHGFE